MKLTARVAMRSSTIILLKVIACLFSKCASLRKFGTVANEAF
jgi:hypothetical protein